MRVGLAGVCLVGFLMVGCNESRTAPSSLTLTPSGAVTVSAPTTFKAVAVNTGGPLTWSLSGRGTLSATSGEWVTYRPPATPTTGETATLTVQTGTFSATAQLQLSPPALTAAQIPGLTAPVDVRYDAWEVPHVKCAQAADCFAVQGYLHARDRLFQMDLLRRAATGRMAELVGPLGLSQDVQLRTLFTTRAGERLGDALARNTDAATKAIGQAYISGINAWLAHLRASGAALPGEYAQLPYPITAADIPDWTLGDMFSFVRLQQYSLSSTLDEELNFGLFAAEFGGADPKLSVWVRTQQPASEQTFTLQPTLAPTPTALMAAGGTAGVASAPNLTGWASSLSSAAAAMAGVRAALQPLDGSTGSNNWVVDAVHSATGKAMVANDPHLSLQYPPNFYLATLTSTNPADHLDVTGGAFPGTPGAQVGRGQHVGWGVTVVGYDVTDVYQEQALANCNPLPAVPPNTAFCVLFNGGPSPVLAYPIAFKVRVGPGDAGLIDAQTLPAAQRPPAVVAMVPHHGPIIKAPDAGGKALSVRWTGHEDNTQDLSAFLGLDTALDVAGAMTALEGWSTGAQNFVLADDAGHIGYYPHALVPKRPWVGTMPGGQPLLPWYPLPGDGSAEWGSGVAADNCDKSGAVEPAAACWIPSAQLPQATSSAAGFLATANADPVGSSANVVGPFGVPLDPNGNYLSFTWDDSTAFRHARITERLQALTKNGGLVSQADMESLQGDHVSRVGAAFERYIAAMPADATPNATTAAYEGARAVLAGWKLGGFDCPSGLLGIDPVLSPVDTNPVVAGNSAGCYLFHEFAHQLLPAVFEDDLGQAGVPFAPIPAVKGMLHMLDNPPGSATPADQSFCNDVSPAGATTTVTCATQVRRALVNAFEILYAQHGNPAGGGWVWGRVHTFQPVSQFPLVTLGYEPGPFARPGGAFTVDVASPSPSGAGFTFRSSANVRHVSVMDPVTAVVRMQLPGPEVSRPYGVVVGPDLLADWARNKYFDYAHGDQILTSTVATQRFTP